MKVIRTLVRKEFVELRILGLIAAVVLCAQAAFLPPVYGHLGRAFGGMDLSGMPGHLAEALRSVLMSFRAYAWSQWYGKNLTQVLLVFTVLFSSAGLAREAARGTGEFLFSRPVARETVYAVKTGVGFGLLFLLTVGSTLLFIVVARLAGHDLPAGWFLSGLPASLAGMALFYALAAALQARACEPFRALGLSVGVIALSGLPALFEATRAYSPLYRMFGSGAAPGTVDWWGAAVLLAGAALAYALGRRFAAGREF